MESTAISVSCGSATVDDGSGTGVPAAVFACSGVGSMLFRDSWGGGKLVRGAGLG